MAWHCIVGRMPSHLRPLRHLFALHFAPCATLTQVFVLDASPPGDSALVVVFDHLVL